MIDNLHNVGANYKSTKTNSQIVVQSLCSTPHKRNTPEKKKPFLSPSNLILQEMQWNRLMFKFVTEFWGMNMEVISN